MLALVMTKTTHCFLKQGNPLAALLQNHPWLPIAHSVTMSNLSFKGLKSRSFIIFFAHNKESGVFAERQGFHPQGGRTESLSKEPKCSHRQPHSSGLDPGSSASPAMPQPEQPWMRVWFPLDLLGPHIQGAPFGLQPSRYTSE